MKINGDMLTRYYQLNEMKKEIEKEMGQLKETFNQFFDETVGVNVQGEFAENGFKLQRQIRKTEKFDEKLTVKRLEEMQMEDLIETVRKPDKTKIHAAIELGLLREEQLEDLRVRNFTRAIVVKEL
ncbi:hypothetical protein JYK21_04830 [Ralstonia pickettii]|nr:hypothetical protein [Ralstonia pickettii]